MATTPARNRVAVLQEQQATPYSKGTSSNQDSDTRRNNADNINRMNDDLEKKIQVSLLSLLKALFAKAPTQERTFDGILSDAVTFCNADLVKGSPWASRCSAMKDYLRRFFAAEDEKSTYHPLAVLLNQALVCDGETMKEGVLFVPNDRIISDSLIFGIDYPGAKRKPDLVAVKASHIRTWQSEWKDDNLGASETQIAKGTNTKEAQENGPTWLDVLASVEVKHRSGQKPDFSPLEERYAKILSEVEETPNSNVGEKRKRDTPISSHSAASKKQKGSASLQPAGTLALPILTVTPEIQCGYYGLEGLRCAWDATHAFVLFIKGPELQLQWYDPQGLIQTSPVHLIRQLPLVVAMLFMLRGFDDPMWGKPTTTLSADFEGASREFRLSADTRPKMYWIGRRTYTAIVQWGPSTTPAAQTTSRANGRHTRASKEQLPDPVSSAGQQSGEEDGADALNTPVVPSSGAKGPNIPATEKQADVALAQYFFKASWPEVTRDKEPHIVSEARERCEKYLGNHQPHVAEHIPTIHGSGELRHTSTAIIRKLLGVEEKHLKPARVLLWMISKKLEPITKLDPDRFWNAFREIIRCHYLLWRIGVAHGDVSLHNLMFDPVSKKGILNDFDLSALMRPGDPSHIPKGWQRTGTIPFMALELLETHDGSIQRRYRHDLESFAWCLFWHCSLQTETEMVRRCNSFDQAYLQKLGILTTFLKGEQYHQVLISQWRHVRAWLEWWKEEYDKKAKKLKEEADKELDILFGEDVGTEEVEEQAPADPARAREEAVNEDKRCLEQCWSKLNKVTSIGVDTSWIDFCVEDHVAV